MMLRHGKDLHRLGPFVFLRLDQAEPDSQPRWTARVLWVTDEKNINMLKPIPY